MNVYPFIFSNHPRYRISRHVIFWSSLILYDTIFASLSWIKYYPFTKTFFANLFVEISSFPLDMIFCYSVIYFFIPRYLFKGKYITMVLLWLLFSLFFIIFFRLHSQYVAPLIYSAYGMPSNMHSVSFAWVFFDLFSQINMEGCMAAAIKLGKMWYIKQQELILLKSEKQKSETQIENGKMQPFFLINALDRVEYLSHEKPAGIPDMIGKIKSLLLYVIYDNNQAKVKLEKELKFLKEYMELEKACSKEELNIKMQISGNIDGERIAPFIILPLVANSFRQLSLISLPNKFFDLNIKVSEEHFYMILIWSKPVDTSTLSNGNNGFLQNIDKRLNLLYPQSHELKAIIKTDRFVIDCKIDLRGAIN
jgi:LytS/YehU family sensor histidine kinase